MTQLTFPDKLRIWNHDIDGKWLTVRDWPGEHSQFLRCFVTAPLFSSKMRKQETDVSRRLSGFDRHAWDAPHKNIPSCVLMWGCVLLIPKQQQNTFFIHQVHKNIYRHSYSLSANPDSSHFCRCQFCKFWPNLPSLQSSCISYLAPTRLHEQNHPQFWFDNLDTLIQ